MVGKLGVALMLGVALGAYPSRGSTALAAPAFHPPVRVPDGTGFEPGIDVSPTGTVFVNEPSGPLLHGTVWRSTNGGLSFSKVQFQRPWGLLPGGFDSDLAPGHGRRVYFLDLWVGSSSVTRSEDDGASWVAGTPLSTLPLTDRSWLAVGPLDPATGQETVYSAYHFIQDGSLMFARSADSGLTWTHHSLPMGPGLPFQPVADDTGFVALAAVDATDNLRVWRSADGGLTWQRAQANLRTKVFGTIGGLALDGDTLHAAWIDRRDFAVRYARSTDRGATWSEEIQLSLRGSNVFPGLAARGGKVAVAWYGADVTVPTDPNRVPGDTRWFLRYTESLDGGLDFTSPVTVAGPVETGVVCTGGLSCPDEDRELGDFLQVALDGQGRAFVAYGDVDGEPGTFVVRQRLA